MMRLIVLLPLLVVAACAQEPADSSPEVWTADRDGLCLTGAGDTLRAGLITYGSGDANCSMIGSASRESDTIRITPTGDRQCTVDAVVNGQSVTLGKRSEACSYYCGPGADFSGKVLQQAGQSVASVKDFAGDPLC